jgi:hypothetical protein
MHTCDCPPESCSLGWGRVSDRQLVRRLVRKGVSIAWARDLVARRDELSDYIERKLR